MSLVNNIKDTLGGILNKFSIDFMSSSNHLVGIDIGGSSVKVAQLAGKQGGYTLTHYGVAKLPEGAIIDGEVQEEEDVISAIQDAVESAGIESKDVCLGLSGTNAIARRLQVSGGTDDDIEDQVMWEAESYLPFDIDEANISIHIVKRNEGGGVETIIAAAKSETVKSFVKMLSSAGLRVKVIDMNMISFINVIDEVLGNMLQDEERSLLLLDIGAQRTTIVVYRNNSIHFSKELSIGGLIITEDIQRQMGVNYEQAEDLKTTPDGDGNLPEEINLIIEDTVSVLLNEIQESISFYMSSTSDRDFAGCVITGGAVLTTSVLEKLESILEMEVQHLNPFMTMSPHKKLSETIVKDAMSMGVNAIGLAMRRG